MNIQGFPFKAAAGDGENLLPTTFQSKLWGLFVFKNFKCGEKMWGGREGGDGPPLSRGELWATEGSLESKVKEV